MRMLAMVIALSACASADTVSRFKYDPEWEERIADPGVVDIECGPKHQSYCGCTDFKRRIIWLSRHPLCANHRDKTRAHEFCHTVLGPSRAAVKMCHEIYPPEKS